MRIHLDDFTNHLQLGHYSPMNISRIRKQRGLTQVDLAELTKLTQPTISRAERGRRQHDYGNARKHCGST